MNLQISKILWKQHSIMNIVEKSGNKTFVHFKNASKSKTLNKLFLDLVMAFKEFETIIAKLLLKFVVELGYILMAV